MCWHKCSPEAYLIDMQRILIVTALFICASAHGQSLLPKAPEAISLLRPQELAMPSLALPATWSYEQLGLFCKLDVQLERHARFPVLFRLGDVQQVERWEGKGPLRGH